MSALFLHPYNMPTPDTICAVTTPAGVSAVGMIKVSGPSALSLVDRIFVPKRRGAVSLAQTEGYQMVYGRVVDHATSEMIDDGMALVYRAPHSYTGEEMVELTLHGSPLILSLVIEQLCAVGARVAERGEFTRRAVLAGQLTLGGAEAVNDVILATNRSALRMSLTQMTGRFGTRIAELRDGLIRVASLLELELDFSEEDVDFVSRPELLQSCEALRAEVLALSESYRKGEAVKRGIPIAIVGSPNVGKSTLLNNLLGEDRAIVSDVEGTTRDTIEGHLFIEGQEFRLMDTAGLRETDDPVESLGIGRTIREVGSALLVLWMIDPRETTEAVDEVWRRFPDDAPEVVALLNKSDVTTAEERRRMSDHLSSLGVHEVIDITGRDPGETKKVTDLLHRHFANLVVAEGEVVVSNLRQAMALRRAADGLARVEEGLKTDQPTVLLAQDLRDATAAMGEVIGDIVTEDLLDTIFSHFCIGK